MGGFKPSRSDIDSSTSVGADITLDSHQFTGSVDITGSLMLNGSAVTGGGGGGAVANYTNSGNNRVITSVDSDTINGEENFTFDGTDLSVSADADTTSSLGRTAIGGAGLADAATVSHVDHNTATNFGFRQRSTGQTEINARADQSINLKLGSQNKVTLNSSGFLGVGENVTPTAILHVSSSTTEPLFRVDHATQAGDKPILFVTGSGLVGIGTAAPREDSANTNRVHILGEEGADQGQNPVQNTLLMLENNNHAGIQFMTPNDKSGMIVWGDAAAARVSHLYYLHNDGRFHFDGATFGHEVMTILSSGDSINIGSSSSDHMITNKASLHISSSAEGSEKGGPVLLKVDGGANSPNILFVTGSGRVGIGTDEPTHTVHVKSTGKASLLLEADTDNTPESDTAYIKLTQDNAATRMIVGLNGNAGADPDGVYLANAMSNAGIIGPRTAGSSLQLVTSNRAKAVIIDDGQVGIGDGFTQGTNPTAILHISGGVAAQGTGKSSPLLTMEYDGVENILFVTGSGRVGINTGEPAKPLEVQGNTGLSGTLEFSGTLTTTSTSTLVGTMGLINSDRALTTVDITGQANNATYIFGIADGSAVGQRKDLIFKVNGGGAIDSSNGLMLTGSNIGAPTPGQTVGSLLLTGSDPGGGFVVSRVAGAQLVWDGSDWQVLGSSNLQYG